MSMTHEAETLKNLLAVEHARLNGLRDKTELSADDQEYLLAVITEGANPMTIREDWFGTDLNLTPALALAVASSLVDNVEYQKLDPDTEELACGAPSLLAVCAERLHASWLVGRLIDCGADAELVTHPEEDGGARTIVGYTLLRAGLLGEAWLDMEVAFDKASLSYSYLRPMMRMAAITARV